MFACRRQSGPFALNPIPLVLISDIKTNPAPASCEIVVDTDGDLSASGNASSFSTLWYSQQLASAGAAHWVRLTVTAGASPDAGAATGSWLSLSSQRTWTWIQVAVGNKTATVTLELATDSAGAAVVATKSGLSISVLVQP